MKRKSEEKTANFGDYFRRTFGVFIDQRKMCIGGSHKLSKYSTASSVPQSDLFTFPRRM